jgi:hypothetical protein
MGLFFLERDCLRRVLPDGHSFWPCPKKNQKVRSGLAALSATPFTPRAAGLHPTNKRTTNPHFPFGKMEQSDA